MFSFSKSSFVFQETYKDIEHIARYNISIFTFCFTMAEMVYPKICSYRPAVWICFLITLYFVETNAHSKIKVGIEHRQRQISRERNDMQDDPDEIRRGQGWIFVEESESNEDRRNKGVRSGKIGTTKVDRARRNEKKNAAKGNKHHEEDLFGKII